MCLLTVPGLNHLPQTGMPTIFLNLSGPSQSNVLITNPTAFQSGQPVANTVAQQSLWVDLQTPVRHMPGLVLMDLTAIHLPTPSVLTVPVLYLLRDSLSPANPIQGPCQVPTNDG